jgi:predicted Zn-dependent protease
MDAYRTTWRRNAAAALAVVLLAAGCSRNPATGQRQLAFIGEEQEIAIGRQTAEQVVQSVGLYPDEQLQSYVNRIGQRLAAHSERPDLPWSFQVVDDPSVNAFALPGGFIYITRGLLTHMSSEAELAAVLGHEIGHVTGRHSVEQMSKAQLAQIGLIAGMVLQPELANYGDLAQTGLGLLFLKYSRDDEREADDLGLRYMLQENYDPRQMAEVFDVLARVSETEETRGKLPGWLSTHPAPENRAERIQAGIREVEADLSNRVVAREPFLRQLDGTVFGQNPREGYFRGNEFIHPELAFRIRFPEGWKPSNQKQAVGAISPRQDAVVVLTLSGRPSPEAAAREFFGQPGVQAGQALQANLGGLPAVARLFGVRRQQGGDLQGIVAFAELGGRVYQILGYTTANRFRSYDDLLSRSLATFARVTDRRLLDVQPKRVDLVEIPRAMTLEEFNRRYPSTVDLRTLAIINHVGVAGRPASIPAGTLVKRVVGGELPG